MLRVESHVFAKAKSLKTSEDKFPQIEAIRFSEYLNFTVK